MKKFNECPACGGKLQISRLSCVDCQAEYPTKEELSPYDKLTEAEMTFLNSYLKNEGNFKALGEELDMSYPTIRKRFDALLITLGFKSKETTTEEEIDMSEYIGIEKNSALASDIIKRKLAENGGIVTVHSLDGKPCIIKAASNGITFSSDKLANYTMDMDYNVFDIIVEFLMEEGGSAPKGAGRNKEDKVGYGKCTLDTVMGIVATKYYGKTLGESTFDPIFVLAAVLDWADVAYNLRGKIQLKPEYKSKISKK